MYESLHVAYSSRAAAPHNGKMSVERGYCFGFQSFCFKFLILLPVYCVDVTTLSHKSLPDLSLFLILRLFPDSRDPQCLFKVFPRRGSVLEALV